jgi:hypothetical protein
LSSQVALADVAMFYLPSLVLFRFSFSFLQGREMYKKRTAMLNRSGASPCLDVDSKKKLLVEKYLEAETK